MQYLLLNILFNGMLDNFINSSPLACKSLTFKSGAMITTVVKHINHAVGNVE